MRPLRGGQGTFDRIVDNIRQVAGQVPDRDRRQLRRGVGRQLPGAARFPARAGVRRQAGQGRLQADHPPTAKPATPKGVIPLTAVGADGKPLNGTCMTSAGAGGRRERATRATSSTRRCRSCARRRGKRGFATVDGVHMGPCEIHRQHAHTIGPDGSLYACPGFTGERASRPGHIDGRQEAWRSRPRPRFDASRRGRSAATAPSSRVRRRLHRRGPHRAR